MKDLKKTIQSLIKRFVKWMSVDATMKYVIGVVVLVALIALGVTWWYIETHPTYGGTNGGGLKVEESGENADTGKFEPVDEDGETESEKNQNKDKDKDKDKGNSGGGLTNAGKPSNSGSGTGTGNGNGTGNNDDSTESKGEVYGPIF